MGKKKKKTPRRRLLRNAAERFARLTNATGVDAVPQKPAPQSGDASFTELNSSAALDYNTKTVPEGTAFTDARGRRYRIGPGGQLQALKKPRSRVKREREQREIETKRAGTDSQRPAQSE